MSLKNSSNVSPATTAAGTVLVKVAALPLTRLAPTKSTDLAGSTTATDLVVDAVAPSLSVTVRLMV